MNLASVNNALSNVNILERAGLGPIRRFDQSQYDDDVDDDTSYGKRQANRKWARFHHGGSSAFTIAFPALIRTRK
jgi:hypothetical protein